MNGKVGVWLDRRRAILVGVSADGEEVKQLESGIVKHPRPSHKSPTDVSQQDSVDRRFADQVDKFYETVIPHLKTAESIIIFGPGEAKKELESSLRKAGLENRVQEVSSMDRLTDRQIIAEIRKKLSA